MPKMKSHSGTKKRVKLTATGKVKVAHANRAHLKSNKNKNTIRNNRSANYAPETEAKRVKKRLAGSK